MADAITTPQTLEAVAPGTDQTIIPTYTPEQVAKGDIPLDAVLLKIQGDLDNETGRIERYTTYREWYAGEQNVVVSDRQKDLFEASGIPFADNFTDLVVDAPVRRLHLVGFTFTPENQGATDFVDQLLKQNRMDIGTQRVHHNSIKLGDAFLIVDFIQSENKVTLTYNKPDIIRPEYDDESGERLLWVSKVWRTEELSPFNPVRDKAIMRMNVYHADRIEKYYRADGDNGDWLPYMDLATDLTWPIPWIDNATNEPLGIPVFHFKNKTLDGDFGVSEIHKAIPQQAVLNKMLMDLDLIMDTQGYPQRWASGVSTETTDTEGNTTNASLPTEPGETWTTDNEAAKFGQFDSAPLDGALQAIDMIIRHLSTSNSTPIDDLLNPKAQSGEALKMKDSGLSDKVEEKEMGFGNVWEDVIKYAIKIFNVFAQGQTKIVLADGTEIDSKWKDTTPRNEKSLVSVLQTLVDMGASVEWALTEYGIENVKAVMAQALEEKQSNADIQISAITRGTDTLTDPTGIIPNGN